MSLTAFNIENILSSSLKKNSLEDQAKKFNGINDGNKIFDTFDLNKAENDLSEKLSNSTEKVGLLLLR